MVLVNENCIGCGICEGIAPTIFKIEGGSSMSRVVKQPENKDENDQVDLAITSCPVVAIEK